MKTDAELKLIACDKARSLSIMLRRPYKYLVKFLAHGLESITGACIDGYTLFYMYEDYTIMINTSRGDVTATVDCHTYAKYAFCDETNETELKQQLTQVIALNFIVPDDTQETIKAKAQGYIEGGAQDADAPRASGTPLKTSN